MQRKSPLRKKKKKKKERNWNDNQKGESISPVVVLIFRSSFSSYLDEERQRFLVVSTSYESHTLYPVSLYES